jgi:pimeloyl-ACP methyl ester carboxylesterase
MAFFKHNKKNIFYTEKGEGELLIILPGNTATSLAHINDIEYFSKRYKSVSIDFLGTGKSDRIENWSVNWWENGAHQINSLIEHLGYKKAILVGTSGGAVIALLTAILFPDKVSSVIADSFQHNFSSDKLKSILLEDRKTNSQEQIKFWKYLHGEDWENVVNSDTEMIIDFINSGGDWFKGRLKKIKCPVLLTGSKEDNFLPNIEESRLFLSKEIKQSKIFLNEKGLHPLMWSQSKIFREITTIFLNNK